MARKKPPSPTHQPVFAGFDGAPAAGTDHDAPERQAGPASCEAIPDLHGKLVVVVDSHSLIYQVFHALPPMTSPTGLPVSAVHGFLGDLLELLEHKKPDYLFCAFDKSEETFRNTLYPQYKAHREPMPDDLRQQIPLIRDLLATLAVGQLECAGFEADDILAKVAAETQQAGGRCLIVTSDKDCRQLITPQVKLYNIRKDIEIGEAELMADWGIRPDQVVDFQAMVGDPVDNVPGIPLVGPKLAQQLLAQFDSLEGIYQNVERIAGPKRKENVIQAREQVLLSRELVRLRTDVPCDIPWSAAHAGHSDVSKLEQACDALGFRRLKTRVREVLGGSQGATASDEKIDLSAYTGISSLEELDRALSTLRDAPLISVDTETTDTNPRRSELVGISIAWKPGAAIYIPVRGPKGECVLELGAVRDRLRPILEDPTLPKIGQNIKYDIVVLRGHGIELQGVIHDTMVADYLIEPGQRNHTLDDLALRYFQHHMISIKELIGSGKNQCRMDEVPLAKVIPYAAEDADVPLRLIPLLLEKLRSIGGEDLYHKVEVPLITVLAEMEYNGIRVDIARLKELSQGFTTQIERLRDEIHQLAGQHFNIDSPKQLSEILYKQLHLPVLKKTKTGPSTDADVLQQLAAMHPIPERIVAYRQATKLKNTYVDALPELVCQKTGRIHTSFRQDVAATGRLSSSEPNLQNIPIRTPEGRAIRSAFTAGEPGWVLLGADYSQIELRVLAHYCGDEALLRAYHEDADIHRRVAAEVHHVREEEVTDDMRRMAKTINFGIVYGQSAFGLARTLGIEKEAAARYIDLYFSRYPGVQDFMLRTLQTARRQGYVQTMLGRRRPVQGVRDFSAGDVGKLRSLLEPERIAVNTVIQGSAADIIKLAMLDVYRRLKTTNLAARLLLQIHDELLLEVAPEDAPSLGQLVQEAMEGVVTLAVPLKVQVSTGADWAQV